MEKYFTTGINMLQAKERTSITHIYYSRFIIRITASHEEYIAHYSRSCLALQGGEFKLYIYFEKKKKEYNTHVRLPGACYVVNPHLSPSLLQA
jgi:hypothetical protein